MKIILEFDSEEQLLEYCAKRMPPAFVKQHENNMRPRDAYDSFYNTQFRSPIHFIKAIRQIIPSCGLAEALGVMNKLIDSQHGRI